MIRTEIRFKNSVFIKALEESKYNSISEFSRVSGIGYSRLIEYANLRYSFKNPEEQVKIARLLNVEIFDLFEQYDEVIHKNKGMVRKLTTDIPIDKVLSLSSDKMLQIESDYNTDNIDDEISIQKEVKDALDTLKEREKDVIKMHFGIGGETPLALSEIAERFKLTKERTRQILAKGIRRLRHRSRNAKLKPFAIISPTAENNSGYCRKYARELESERKKHDKENR
tara:strand:+ start:1235 stop:1912 length:678 start_codon:yes stop_codon:yes gene_type:complete